MWSKESNPVDQLVCVWEAVTTKRNRESGVGAQSSSYMIKHNYCRGMLNA